MRRSVADALPLVDEEPALRPSAASVCGPTMPSTRSPLARWKRLTARRVWGPKTPSAVTPSARWTAATSTPGATALVRFAGACWVLVAAAAPPARTSDALSAAMPARRPRNRRSCRAASARRRRERRWAASQGSGEDRSVVGTYMNLAGHHAYGVSCRARAFDLRYAARWRRFAPWSLGSHGSPAPLRRWRRGLGWFNCSGRAYGSPGRNDRRRLGNLARRKRDHGTQHAQCQNSCRY